jgi:hypothetical protein
MPLPKPREPGPFAEAINAIQKARPTPLSIFTDEDEEAGQQYRDYHDVEVLNLVFEPDKIIWRNLHNDPNVEIISEQEKSNKISTLTYIKFIRRVPIDEPDPQPETFAEPCEEGDPLLDEMWGE